MRDWSTDSHYSTKDQAHGLRQMFAAKSLYFVPLVSNPQVIYGGIVLERLCAAFAALGLKTLVFDDGERARIPTELSFFDLHEGIEHLSDHVKYMPARDLPLKFADEKGDSGELLDLLTTAANQVDVVILHASAIALIRLLARRAKGYNLRPLVFTDDSSGGITQAYTSIKQMAKRASWLNHDLLICAENNPKRSHQIATRLAQCAENFLHAAQHNYLQVSPLESATQEPDDHFMILAADLLSCAWKNQLMQNANTVGMAHMAALPARRTPVFN